VAIYYFNEDVGFTLNDEAATSDWIQNILYDESFVDENINYIFCSDSYLLQMNKEYLDHDTLTDIITFDNSEEEGHIEADIFISIERIKENAALLKKDFHEELLRVMIHGILHIMGYSDKTDKEKQVMREKEDACLSLR
jgi:probable rRNA maturation factor